VVWVLNRSKVEEQIPITWQHLMAWGSLRGALAITMVLLIPEDLTVAGWNLTYTPREFILALTIGCIFTTLFLKATTIKKFAHNMGIGRFTDLEQVGYGEARALLNARIIRRITRFTEKGYIDGATSTRLLEERRASLAAACAECEARVGTKGAALGLRVLRLYAIGIELQKLKSLYEYGEVSEKIYRRVESKLNLQHEHVEEGHLNFNPSHWTDRKDIFDRMARQVDRLLYPDRLVETVEDRYMYYRTQTVLSRTVLSELTELNTEHSMNLFGPDTFTTLQRTYQEFLEGSSKKMAEVCAEVPYECKNISERLARHSVLGVESKALEDLLQRQMITQKTYLALHDEMEMEAEVVAGMEHRSTTHA
jgi:CPA1 family monovalent cation:H+ antiporter